MKRCGALTTCLLFTSLAVPSSSSAQSRPHTREGPFIGLGFGLGSLGCSGCDGGRAAGGVGYVKFGGPVNERVLLGLEINLWSKWEWPPAMEREGVTLTSGVVAAVIQFYPNAESGLFLKAGAGIDSLSEGPENGFGVIGGLGFDAPVGSTYSVSPYVNYVYGSNRDQTKNMFQIGLGIMWHEL